MAERRAFTRIGFNLSAWLVTPDGHQRPDTQPLPHPNQNSHPNADSDPHPDGSATEPERRPGPLGDFGAGPEPAADAVPARQW